MFAFLKQMDRKSKTVIWICYFAFFINGIFSLMMGSVMPDLKAAYGLTDTLSGVLLSAHSAGNLFAGVLFTVLPLVIGKRWSVLALSGTAFLGFLMMLISGNPLWLIIAFVFTGIGRGSITSFTNKETNRVTGGNPSASNCLHASFAAGSVLAPIIFLVFSKMIGWKAGLLFCAVCGLARIWFLDRMEYVDDSPEHGEKENNSLEFLKNPSYLILAMMIFCYLCAEYSINGWLVTYIQNKQELLSSFGKTGEELENAVKSYSQTMAALLWVVMLVGRLSCAYISTKVPQKKLMMFLSLGAAAFFMMMLASSSITMVTIAVAGTGLCMAGICPMIYSDAAVFTNTYSAATSGLLVIGSSGSMLMNFLVGFLADRFGFAGGMKAILVAVVLLAFFSVLNLIVKTKFPVK